MNLPLSGRTNGEEETREKIHASIEVISLCQVGPNREDRLITAPAGDEWVSQAARLDGGVDGQIHTRKVRVGLWVCLCKGDTHAHARTHAQ